MNTRPKRSLNSCLIKVFMKRVPLRSVSLIHFWSPISSKLSTQSKKKELLEEASNSLTRPQHLYVTSLWRIQEIRSSNQTKNSRQWCNRHPMSWLIRMSQQDSNSIPNTNFQHQLTGALRETYPPRQERTLAPPVKTHSKGLMSFSTSPTWTYQLMETRKH